MNKIRLIHTGLFHCEHFGNRAKGQVHRLQEEKITCHVCMIREQKKTSDFSAAIMKSERKQNRAFRIGQDNYYNQTLIKCMGRTETFIETQDPGKSVFMYSFLGNYQKMCSNKINPKPSVKKKSNEYRKQKIWHRREEKGMLEVFRMVAEIPEITRGRPRRGEQAVQKEGNQQVPPHPQKRLP